MSIRPPQDQIPIERLGIADDITAVKVVAHVVPSPPSTECQLPLMYEASSEARNVTSATILCWM